jgi:hypothetical protein
MVASQKDAAYYRAKAEQCRRLARQVSEDDVRKALLDLAREFEGEAATIEAPPPKKGCDGC